GRRTKLTARPQEIRRSATEHWANRRRCAARPQSRANRNRSRKGGRKTICLRPLDQPVPHCLALLDATRELGRSRGCLFISHALLVRSGRDWEEKGKHNTGCARHGAAPEGNA